MSDPTWFAPRVEALADLLPERRRALLDSLAGTGKTECVAQLAISLVLEHDVAAERILIVSFNEKAAREARDRVRSVAERLLAPPTETPPPATPHRFQIDAPARGALRDLLRRPPRVQTIHAWARELLGREAFAAGFPITQRLVGRSEAFGAAFRDLVRRRLARDDAPDLVAWLEERSLERLEALLRRCAGEAPTTLLRPRLDPDGARARLEAVATLHRRTWARLRIAVDAHAFGRATQTQRKLVEVLRALPDRIERAHAGGGRLSPHGPRLAGDVRYVVEKLARYSVAAPQADPLPERLAALATALVSFDAAAANLWTEPARQAYEAHKRDLGGALDFDDLLGVLEEALARPGGDGLRARIRAGCDAVLIDEVQDANATIYGYADEAGRARGLFRPLFVDEGFAGRTFLAGDGHQSIYGWRGADVHGGFLTARRDMHTQDAVVRLRASYRSTPPFVEALNVLFDQTAEPPFFQGSIDYADPAQVGRPDLRLVDASGADAPPVRVLAVEEGSRLRVGPVRAALARAIAAEVDRVCRTDAGALTLTEPGKPRRRLGLADVFVLVRSHREAREVHQALRSFDPPIPSVLHKAGGLFAGPEAEDVADLLAGLAAPERTDLVRRAFLTPFLGVPIERLSGLGDLPPGDPLLLRWRGWVRRAERHLPALLITLLSDARLDARAAFAGLEGERSVVRYQSLLELLATHLARTGVDVGGLLAWLEGRRAEADADEHPAPQPGAAEDAVRVMTVYAAKGLGAGCVFLTGGFTARDDGDGVKIYQAFNDDEGEPETPYPVYEPERVPPRYEVYHDAQGRRVLHVGPLDEQSEPLYHASRREQDTFLLYTAITRGVGRVVLPFVPRDAGGAWAVPRLAGAYYEPVNLRLEQILAARADDPRLTALFDVTPVALESPPPAPPPAAWSRLATWSPPAELLVASDAVDDRQTLTRAHKAQVVVSYSSLKRSQHDPRALVHPEVHADVQADEAAAPAPGVSTEALRGGRHTGNLLHDLFEHVDLAAVGQATDLATWGALPEVDALSERLAARYGLPPEQRPRALEVVFHTLRRAIDLGPGLRLNGLWSSDCLREPEFRVPLPASGDAVLGQRLALRAGFLTGALDLLLRRDGAVVGIDWKSDPLDDYGPAALHAKVMQDYPIQLAAYSYVLAKLAGVGDDPSVLDAGLDVRMAYVFVRATGLATGAPDLGVRVYRLDAAGYRRVEAFLREVS